MIKKNELYASLKKIKDTKDKDGLYKWIYDVFKIKIPRVKVCEDHDAPMDFVASVFFEEYQNIIAVANRTGGKTLDFSVLDVLNSYLHPNCETATVGAIEDQAKRCYGYVQDHISNIDIFQEKVEDSLMSSTKWKNDSMIQILTGTIRGVNSPHPQKVFLDEVELMVWMVLQEAFSMAQSKNNIKGQTIITSTRKYAFGSMERLLNEADTRGFKIFKWCVRETIAPHDPEICKNSIYHEDCQGRCQLGDGFLDFDDVLSKKRQLDEDTWKSQWLCEKPMQTGLVYPQFNDSFHVRPIEPIVTAPLYLSEDPGFAQGHADVVGFWQVTPKGVAQLFDEIWIEGKTDDEIIDLVEDKLAEHKFVLDRYKKKSIPRTDLFHYTSKVTAWYMPNNEPAGIALRVRRGYKVSSQDEAELTKIVNGLPLVRKALQDRTIVIDPRCRGTINEMRIYANKIRSDGTILDEPEKKNDNAPDMIRYFYINHFPARASGGFKGDSRDDTMITAGVGNITF